MPIRNPMTRSRIGFCFDRRSSWNMSQCTIYTRTILTFLSIFTTNNNCCVNIRSLFFNIPLYLQLPALLKEWLDCVLSRGFASGMGGNALAGKYWRSVITTGEPEGAYRTGGYNRYPMEDILRPFELTAAMCHMHWLTPMLVYWARRQKPEVLESHATAYGDWLRNPLPHGGR